MTTNVRTERQRGSVRLSRVAVSMFLWMSVFVQCGDAKHLHVPRKKKTKGQMFTNHGNGRVAMASSSSGSSSSSSSSINSVGSSVAIQSEELGSNNPVVGLFNYAKESCVRVYQGSVELYTNHQRCNTIRSKQKAYATAHPVASDSSSPSSHVGGGITYEEYDFLIRGKEDRSKVTSLFFMSVFSPNFLPYAFLFFPHMLPSTLQPPESSSTSTSTSTTSTSTSTSTSSSNHKNNVLSRDLAHVVVSTLVKLEQRAHAPVRGNLLLPFLGKQKAKDEQTKLRRVEQTAGRLLLSSSADPHSRLLRSLRHHILTQDSPTKEQTDLVIVPKLVLQGLAKAIDVISTTNTNTNPILANFTPHYFTRTKVMTHLDRVSRADAFLTNHNVNLDDLDGALLRRACRDRLILSCGDDDNDPALRRALETWLEWSVRRPETMRVIETTTDDNDSNDANNNNNNKKKRKEEYQSVFRVAPSSPSPNDHTVKEENIMYYNQNVAKVALLCYNAVDRTRAMDSASVLPKLLFFKR